jgi:hypothetical protein
MSSVDEGTSLCLLGIHPLFPTVLAYDSIDTLKEILSGAGTSHGVNGIIVQPAVLMCATDGLPTPALSKWANV